MFTILYSYLLHNCLSISATFEFVTAKSHVLEGNYCSKHWNMLKSKAFFDYASSVTSFIILTLLICILWLHCAITEFVYKSWNKWKMEKKTVRYVKQPGRHVNSFVMVKLLLDITAMEIFEGKHTYHFGWLYEELLKHGKSFHEVLFRKLQRVMPETGSGLWQWILNNKTGCRHWALKSQSWDGPNWTAYGDNTHIHQLQF